MDCLVLYLYIVTLSATFRTTFIPLVKVSQLSLNLAKTPFSLQSLSNSALLNPQLFYFLKKRGQKKGGGRGGKADSNVQPGLPVNFRPRRGKGVA